MNKLVIIVSLLIINFICLNISYASSVLPIIDIAGQYTCAGYDKIDKDLTQKLTIILDTKNSNLTKGYGAYKFIAKVPTDIKVKGLPPNIVVRGAIATSGNSFSMSFQNTNPKASADYGTAVGNITNTQYKNGIIQTELSIFSYQPTYKGGDTSLWTCRKVT